MAELLDTKVRRKAGLTALLADDTNAYVCRLDHGDVVPTVADTAYAFPSEGTDEPGYVGLLGGCATAGDYCRELYGEGYELRFVRV